MTEYVLLSPQGRRPGPFPQPAGLSPSSGSACPPRSEMGSPMRYFARRIGFFFLTLWAAVTLNFIIPRLQPGDPGQQYGYGIAQVRWAANTIYFHGGETAGYNSFMGHDPTNQMTLVVWTNLTVSLDMAPTANALMLKVLDQIYVDSPLAPSSSPTNAP